MISITEAIWIHIVTLADPDLQDMHDNGDLESTTCPHALTQWMSEWDYTGDGYIDVYEWDMINSHSRGSIITLDDNDEYEYYLIRNLDGSATLYRTEEEY